MNKWVVFLLFYAALALSVTHESEPWVRLAWLIPILVWWVWGAVVASRWGWKNRNRTASDWQPTTHIWGTLPKPCRDWLFGEGRHRS